MRIISGSKGTAQAKMDALREAGVETTVKHFPGLGLAVTNTDDDQS